MVWGVVKMLFYESLGEYFQDTPNLFLLFIFIANYIDTIYGANIAICNCKRFMHALLSGPYCQHSPPLCPHNPPTVPGKQQDFTSTNNHLSITATFLVPTDSLYTHFYLNLLTTAPVTKTHPNCHTGGPSDPTTEGP